MLSPSPRGEGRGEGKGTFRQTVALDDLVSVPPHPNPVTRSRPLARPLQGLCSEQIPFVVSQTTQVPQGEGTAVGAHGTSKPSSEKFLPSLPESQSLLTSSTTVWVVLGSSLEFAKCPDITNFIQPLSAAHIYKPPVLPVVFGSLPATRFVQESVLES